MGTAPNVSTDGLTGLLRTRLEERRRSGLYRVRSVGEGMAKPRRMVAGREVLSFCSNDYLGLASDRRVVEAFRRGAETFGAGTGASCLVNGYTRAHRELEEYLAEFTGRDRALLFSTGYMANLGAVGVLAGRGASRAGYVFGDRLNHASLIDAALLSQARVKRYPHADVAALERMLDAHHDRGVLVATDAVFSMDGDVAPLAGLTAACARYDAALMVDDAHGFGVFGTRGAGTLEERGLSQRDVPVLVATFGKACGTFGAFIAGDEDLIQCLIQEARSYAYTTAPPAAIACATLESLRVMENEPWRRNKLHDNVETFRRLAEEAGLACTGSCTPIQPLIVGDAATAVALSDALLDDGLQVTAIRPPTVPQGASRLRVTLSAAHEAGDVERLVRALARRLKQAKTPLGNEAHGTGAHLQTV